MAATGRPQGSATFSIWAPKSAIFSWMFARCYSSLWAKLFFFRPTG